MRGFNKPDIGDIVVFNSPENIDVLLVKRISQIQHANSLIHLDSTNYNYYLLGDNSSISRDSRFFGYVSEKNLVGKVNRLIFSINKTQINILKRVK